MRQESKVRLGRKDADKVIFRGRQSVLTRGAAGRRKPVAAQPEFGKALGRGAAGRRKPVAAQPQFGKAPGKITPRTWARTPDGAGLRRRRDAGGRAEEVVRSTGRIVADPAVRPSETPSDPVTS